MDPQPTLQNQNPQPDNSPVTPPAATPPTPTAAPTMTPVSPVAGNPKRRFPKWLGIVLGVIIGLVVVGGILFFSVMQATKAPQKVSDQFVNAIQAKDSSAAYQLTNDAFKEATSADDMQDFVDSIGPQIQGEEKITDRTIQKSTGSATNATFIYTVSTSAGTVYIKTVLQQTGDQWQVYNIKTDSEPLTTDSN